jgi:hypothetical protein
MQCQQNRSSRLAFLLEKSLDSTPAILVLGREGFVEKEQCATSADSSQ